MNMKTVIPLSVAILLGLVAAVMVRNAIARHSSVSQVASNLVSVVVAKQDIDPGKSLTKDDLVIAKVPADIAPGHVFSDINQLVGRVVTSPLSKGQTVMETLLASIGSGGGLQALIPPGMRAITVEVNEYSSVGGMLEPGCRVDLISTMNDPKTHEQMAKTVLQNVKVTAIGRNVTAPHPVEGQPAPPASNSVTLLLTPKQAQSLQLACMSSRPWLVLRSYLDHSEQPIEALTVSQLRGDPTDESDAGVQPQPVSAPPLSLNPFTPIADEPPKEVAPTTLRRTITIIQGGVEHQETFSIPAPASAQSTVDTDSDQVPGATK